MATKTLKINGDLEVNNIVTTNGQGNLTNIFDLIYPVDSIYMSINNNDPATLFGIGTWEQIEDCYLYAKQRNETGGTTYGQSNYIIQSTQMPKHTHSYTPSGTISTTTDLTGEAEFIDLMNIGAVDEKDLLLDASGVFSRTGGSNRSGTAETNSQDGESDILKINVNHTHTFTGTTAQTETAGGNSGNQGPSPYKPKYIALYVWKRTN